MAAIEEEVLWARRAFPKAQELLAGEADHLLGRISLGWHHTDISPEAGSFCIVRRGGPYEDLLGDILILTVGLRAPIYVYVLNTAPIVADISLARRAFLALGRLSHDRIQARVEVRV